MRKEFKNTEAYEVDLERRLRAGGGRVPSFNRRRRISFARLFVLLAIIGILGWIEVALYNSFMAVWSFKAFLGIQPFFLLFILFFIATCKGLDPYDRYRQVRLEALSSKHPSQLTDEELAELRYMKRWGFGYMYHLIYVWY